MAAVDMSRINFYQPPPASSPCSSLKPPILGNTGVKRTATLERDWWDKPSTTNRKIEPLFQTQMAGDTRAGDGENSIRAGNNRGGGDSGTNNEEDFCFPSIEPIESPHNLSSETEKSTPIPREKIGQALSHDEFFNVDEFLPPAGPWTASLASDQSQLQGGAAQPPVKQSPPWRMPNLTLPTDDEPMAATATLESWDFPKRKADTIDLDEGSRVKIHERSFGFLNNTGTNDRFDKSIIKPTLEPSNGWNKNLDIMPSRTPSKPLSKQVLAFSGLSGHNSKRETQAQRSEDSIVIDDTDEDRTDTDDHDLPPSKKGRGAENATLQAVFKVPPELGLYYNRALQDHENTASSNRSSEVGGSQDNPFVVRDEDIKTDDEGTSAEIESIMSEIDTADTQLNTPCSAKEPKTHHFSDPNTTAEPFNRKLYRRRS